ncbi:unnamed protein product [Closterium sp. Naga37s-1]|nr:unnamed protein product [Closterium sp. Naga37s-1]
MLSADFCVGGENGGRSGAYGGRGMDEGSRNWGRGGRSIGGRGGWGGSMGWWRGWGRDAAEGGDVSDWGEGGSGGSGGRGGGGGGGGEGGVGSNMKGIVGEGVALLDDEEVERMDDEVIQALFERVVEAQTQLHNYKNLVAFSLFTALYLLMLCLQAQSFQSYQVASAHSILLPPDYSGDSSYSFASSSDFYTWLNNSIIQVIWSDPQCGDGTCTPPTEFPAVGRFGCAQDCGNARNVTTVTVALRCHFASREAMVSSSWNLCSTAIRDVCWFQDPQTFTELTGWHTVTVRLPDNDWFVSLTAPTGGVGVYVYESLGKKTTGASEPGTDSSSGVNSSGSAAEGSVMISAPPPLPPPPPPVSTAPAPAPFRLPSSRVSPSASPPPASPTASTFESTQKSTPPPASPTASPFESTQKSTPPPASPTASPFESTQKSTPPPASPTASPFESTQKSTPPPASPTASPSTKEYLRPSNGTGANVLLASVDGCVEDGESGLQRCRQVRCGGEVLDAVHVQAGVCSGADRPVPYGLSVSRNCAPEAAAALATPPTAPVLTHSLLFTPLPRVSHAPDLCHMDYLSPATVHQKQQQQHGQQQQQRRKHQSSHDSARVHTFNCSPVPTVPPAPHLLALPIPSSGVPLLSLPIQRCSRQAFTVFEASLQTPSCTGAPPAPHLRPCPYPSPAMSSYPAALSAASPTTTSPLPCACLPDALNTHTITYVL